MKLVSLFLLFLVLLRAELAYSQYSEIGLVVELPVQTIDAVTIREDPRIFNLHVVNEGDSQSQPFRLKLWLSIDNNFTESDRPTIYSSSDVLGPCVSTSCPSERFVRNFRFPYPGLVVPAEEKLAGDTRTAEQWIGENLYVKACISENNGPFIKCQEGAYPVRPHEPNTNNTATSTRDLLDSIELTWEASPFSFEQANVDFYYGIDEVGQFGSRPGRAIRVPLNEVETFVDETGVKRERITITDIIGGGGYSYRPLSCYASRASEEVCQSSTGFIAGSSYGRFTASRGTDRQGVLVEWQEFSTTTQVYRLERCRKFGECVSIIVPNSVETYLDTDVQPAEEYRYTVSTCRQASLIDPIDCDSDSVETGSSNFGYSDIRDAYENDNSSALATRITQSVSQDRTFHDPNDVDWLRLIIPTAQSITVATSGNSDADTLVTLYDESGSTKIDDSNVTDGVNTSYATLVTDVIPAGTYLVKINQNFIPGISETLALYQLDITIEGSSPVILAPVINLLLEEQRQPSTP